MTDIERMLRQLARERVDEAARALRPVHPQRVAEDVVASRLNMAAVVAHRDQLIAAIADFVRELRASPDHTE
jgi:hypothetical protein